MRTLVRSGILTLLVVALCSSVALAAAKKRGKSAAAPAKSTGPVVALKTSLGTVRLQLDPAKAPVTVENFLKYVDAKFYDGTVFHRVIAEFMIQGGGMTSDLKEKPTRAPIRNEAKNGLKNVRGTIAMARLPSPDSATSQFFINTVDNPGLDAPYADGYGYAVFGKVVEGMEVVDKIRVARTTTRGDHANCPVEPVVIESARRE